MEYCDCDRKEGCDICNPKMRQRRLVLKPEILKRNCHGCWFQNCGHLACPRSKGGDNPCVTLNSIWVLERITK